ncbi:putative methyltransferase DDB_G0268948 [Watersipora subatra]|uniref:putative methyltransferase DDB_G0268948 n=1 Tax=Watersipora subatra TaxID=2589382 RepID=UPI00355BCBB8
MSIRRFDSKEHAEAYKKYRPVFGEELFVRIMEYVWSSPVARKPEGLTSKADRLSLAADIGCGSGQSTKGLAKFFESVIGLDVSKEQIQQAIANNTLDNIQFKVSTAEDLPLDAVSVDLVTVGMALHWFDWPTFYKEVDRILKPGGVIAIYMHSLWLEVIDHPKAPDLTSFLTALVREEPIYSYWHDRDRCVDARYTEEGLQIPYPDTERDESMALYITTNIEGLFGYLSTGSPLNCYRNAHEEKWDTFWSDTINRFCELYGSTDMSSPLKYKLQVYLLLGRKP